MKTKITYIIILTLFAFTSCIDDDNDVVDFTASQYSSTNHEISIAFFDRSSFNAIEYMWEFEGGTPQVSYEKNPIVSYTEAGTYDVTLTIKTNNGYKEVTMFDYINIGDFYNPTWADIYITQNSQTKVVGIDETILLANIGRPVISYYAETSGLTAQGNQIGLLIYWDENVYLNDRDLYWDFIIDDIFVFLNFKNDGTDNFSSITANLGDSDYEITDNVIIPNDKALHSTGYYDAWSDMEIVAYFENTNGFVSWVEGVHFDLLWELTQGVDLWYDGSKSTFKAQSKSKSMRKNGSKPLVSSGAKR